MASLTATAFLVALLCLVLSAWQASAFTFSRQSSLLQVTSRRSNALAIQRSNSCSRRVSSQLQMNAPNQPEVDPATVEKIQQLIKSDKVVLFMKGDKEAPQWCVTCVYMKQLYLQHLTTF